MNIRTYALSALLAAAVLPMAAQAGQSTAQLHVKLVINGSCNISITDVDFGTVPSIGAGLSTTGSINVNCTDQLGYNIGIGPGQNSGGDVSARKMSAGGTDEVTYSLRHTSATGDIWGNSASGGTGVSRVSDTGTGAAQEHKVYAAVDPQTTPPNGTYEDTLTVTVSW